MSDIRIALVAEGPTDRIVIEAALRALVPCAFILTVLQPEKTLPELGNGWGGVLKWCVATGKRHAGSLDSDPTLQTFDIVVIHLDADVSTKQYLDCGPSIADLAAQRGWMALPLLVPCPPVAGICAQLQTAVAGWMAPACPGLKTIFCIPAASTGTWLASAVLPSGHTLLAGPLECKWALENQLSQLPKAQRIRKSVADFRMHDRAIQQKWAGIEALCTQAQAFGQALRPIATVACQIGTGNAI